MSENARITVDIGICTFRRTHIRQTLESVAGLRLPADVEIKVIVADNDDTPTARERVENVPLPFEKIYLHAPARNISIARNACLERSDAHFLAFIDDDEIVSPEWLSELLKEQRKSGAAVVLGPAEAIYPEDAPKWMQEGNYHSSHPVWVDGKIITGYTCNALIDMRSHAVTGLRFRPELGRTGGEDVLFFSAIHRDGGAFSYAPKAIVTEQVAPNRATLGWLINRKISFGHIHGLVLMEGSGASVTIRLVQGLSAFAKFSCCLVVALLMIPSATQSRRWLLRGLLHAGVMSRLSGGKGKEVYGEKQAGSI